jgi:DNA-directed RNA polymerase sigma subunit (sigma70/sigma32)
MKSWQRRNMERALATRERQVAEFRTRRLGKVHTDPHSVAVVRRGFAELDRMEARGIPMSRDEVAVSLGLSREAVRLIEQRALAKVMAALLGVDALLGLDDTP